MHCTNNCVAVKESVHVLPVSLLLVCAHLDKMMRELQNEGKEANGAVKNGTARHDVEEGNKKKRMAER